MAPAFDGAQAENHFIIWLRCRANKSQLDCAVPIFFFFCRLKKQNKTKLDLLFLHQHSIDCAGILKLRNSDIELRKGETDIGRKNTRVRMVFRVHINQATGRTVSLQVSSNPIECCE